MSLGCIELAEKFKDIEKQYPGYTVNYGGEEEDRKKSMSNLALLFLFALVGVVLALLAHGQPMSFMSTLGIVSLAGVIVSNTLVLIPVFYYIAEYLKGMTSALLAKVGIRMNPTLIPAEDEGLPASESILKESEAAPVKPRKKRGS